MSEQLNQTNQEPTKAPTDSSDVENAIDFEKLSEEEMKAVAKGLMVDFVWTLSGMNQASKEEDAHKHSKSEH
jgi:hypothetical protein